MARQSCAMVEIEEKVRRIKKEEGKIQIEKVSKNENTNKPHSLSAEINKWIAGTKYLLTYGPWARTGPDNDKEKHGEREGLNEVVMQKIIQANEWALGNGSKNE